jgi:hypothetical protein
MRLINPTIQCWFVKNAHGVLLRPARFGRD